MNHSGIPADRWNPRVQAQIAAQMEQDAARRGAKLQTIPTSPPEPQKPATAVEQGKTRLLFELPYPPSANAYWRSIVINGQVRVLVSTQARHYKRMVLQKYAYTKSLAGPLRLTLTLFRPRKIGDLSNRIKVVEDALNGIAYWDDSQIVEIVATRHDDKANPRVVVVVEQMP